MSDKIKLDIISDVVCPWCIVGYKHLEAAITELNIQDKVELQWQPFELNPDMPPEGEELRAHVARKYGASREDSDQARLNISQAGAKYGFEFNYADDMKIVNTLDAHRLLEYAHEIGLQTKLKLRLFSAFFSEHKDVSDRQILTQEAIAVGFSPEQVQNVFTDETNKIKVKELEHRWQQMGVTGVPTVVFNGESALTGAHPQATFKQVLQDLLAQ